MCIIYNKGESKVISLYSKFKIHKNKGKYKEINNMDEKEKKTNEQPIQENNATEQVNQEQKEQPKVEDTKVDETKVEEKKVEEQNVEQPTQNGDKPQEQDVPQEQEQAQEQPSVQEETSEANGIRIEDVVTKDILADAISALSAKLDAIIDENKALKEKLATSEQENKEIKDKYEVGDFGTQSPKGVQTKNVSANETFDDYAKQFM